MCGFKWITDYTTGEIAVIDKIMGGEGSTHISVSIGEITINTLASIILQVRLLLIY